MQTLLIIDGHHLLFQMFFGMPSRIINQYGKAIQGTLGFVGALIKIIKMTTPTHVVVIFDGEHENERTKIDTEYKANRTDYSTVEEQENPFSQLQDIYTALDFMKIKYAETDEYETDDVIASYALKYGNDMRIVIGSGDSDFFQLINDNISVLRYRGKKTIICDKDYMQDKYGIRPDQYADFKSLTGDSSDNIKGVNKVGIKTAGALINQFESLEHIIAQADEIDKLSIRESVKANTELLRRNYNLIKLTDKAALPYKIDELNYEYSGIATSEVLQKIGLK